MKTTILLAILINFSISLLAQEPNNPAGWISIDFNSFGSKKIIPDDPLNFDGFGNEVYFVTFYSVADRNGITKFSSKLVSKVYGDTYRFADRIKAGDANPDGTGGLRSGDQPFPGSEFPEITKVRLEDGDFITVIPTIWEWDNESNSQLQAAFESRMLNSFHAINLKSAAAIQYCYGYNGCELMSHRSSSGVPSFADLLKPLISKAGSRPIGMDTSGEYFPTVFVLNAKMIISQNSRSAEPGKFYSWHYRDYYINDNVSGNSREQGEYYMRFHFNFELDKPKVTNKSVPPAATINTPRPSIIVPISTTTIKYTAPNITVAQYLIGKWNGTQTSAEGFYPQRFAFELTANNEFLMKDANGGLVSKGNYSFSNNVFSGSYKLLSSSETLAIAGAFDAQTQQLKFSLGVNGSTTNQGKVVATKQ